MRIQTEVGALALFISSILVLLTTTNPTALKTVVIYDFFFCGVLNLTIQLCETFMFYSRYRAICRIPNFTRYQIHCFIWILCVLPRFPAYNIVPAFYNTNSDLFTYAFNISNACSTACIVLYNFYFTLQFSKILLFIYNPMMIETPFHALEKIKSVGFRSIGHCFTSSLAAVFYIVFPHWGRILQELVIVVGMHFWFNTTIDRDGCLYQLCNLNETLFSESGKDSGGAHSVIDEELRLDMNEINNRYVVAACLRVCLLACLPVCLPICLPVYLHIYLSACLRVSFSLSSYHHEHISFTVPSYGRIIDQIPD